MLFLKETIFHNIIQLPALTGYDITSFLYGVGKIKPFQKIAKNTNLFELLANLGHTTSANDVIKGSYVETKLRLHNKQKRKNLISLPPDPLSCKRGIR